MRLPDIDFPDLLETPPLRWGVAGPGTIANDFVDALAFADSQRVVAVGSRSLDRAEQFAARHGVRRAHGSYAGLADDPEVDAVYVAVPHSHHVAVATTAIACGKHVLVEKPIATNAAEARDLHRIASAAGVLAMEAMWTQYLPQAYLLRRVLDEGLLGPIRSFTAHLSGGPIADPDHRLLDTGLAGGALLDTGVYSISLALTALGDARDIVAAGLVDGGVDIQSSVSFRSAPSAFATVTTSIAAASKRHATVAGELARLEFEDRFFEPTRVRLVDPNHTEIESWVDSTPRSTSSRAPGCGLREIRPRAATGLAALPGGRCRSRARRHR